MIKELIYRGKEVASKFLTEEENELYHPQDMPVFYSPGKAIEMRLPASCIIASEKKYSLLRKHIKVIQEQRSDIVAIRLMIITLIENLDSMVIDNFSRKGIFDVMEKIRERWYELAIKNDVYNEQNVPYDESQHMKEHMYRYVSSVFNNMIDVFDQTQDIFNAFDDKTKKRISCLLRRKKFLYDFSKNSLIYSNAIYSHYRTYLDTLILPTIFILFQGYEDLVRKIENEREYVVPYTREHLYTPNDLAYNIAPNTAHTLLILLQKFKQLLQPLIEIETILANLINAYKHSIKQKCSHPINSVKFGKEKLQKTYIQQEHIIRWNKIGNERIKSNR